MADHEESVMEKIADKFHGGDSSSSLVYDDEKESPPPPSPSKPKVYRILGREQPLHKVLGAGKPADVFLWRDKKISGVLLVGVTAIWVLFEIVGYNLFTLVGRGLILAVVPRILEPHKSRPSIPEVHIPEEPVLEFASALTIGINQGFRLLREIALGRDLKKFLAVIAGLWILSTLGSCCNFLTLFYIAFVLLHTVPVLYEKYEDHVDAFAEKAVIETKKQYAVFNEKVLSKIPKGPLKDKKA